MTRILLCSFGNVTCAQKAKIYWLIVSDMAVFVLKRDAKLQSTNQPTSSPKKKQLLSKIHCLSTTLDSTHYITVSWVICI